MNHTWNFELASLPPELFHAIEELEHERTKNGVDSTPDETADVIEVIFLTLGRFYLAELWYATTTGLLNVDNRDVLSLLLDSRDANLQSNLTMGRWVGLSRKIATVFNQAGLHTQLVGLDSVDWGTPGDTTNTVNRLIDFRNRFAHGSFSAPEDIIETHYQLLIELVTQVRGLYTQLIVATAPAFGISTLSTWRSGVIEAADVVNGPPTSNANHVWLQTSDGWMGLSPFFEVTSTDSVLHLILSNFSSISVDALFHSAVLERWQNRYNNDYTGHIDRNEVICSRATPPCPPELQSQIEGVVANNQGQSIQIIGHPGTGLHSVLPFIQSQVIDVFDHVICWDIQPDDLTQSGVVLMNKLEQILQPPPVESKRPSLKERVDALETVLVKQKVLLAVDGLAFASQTYRFEPFSVLDVLNTLVDSAMSILLVSYFSDHRHQVFYDDQIIWNERCVIDINVLKTVISERCTTPLHQRILTVLSKHTCTLFELCDQLDQHTDTVVFEPAVEYALWELRPLLYTEMQTRSSSTQTERVWTVFSKEVTL